jgi:dienelactone hydrolase
MRALFVLVLALAAGSGQAASHFGGAGAPGPHGVGLRVVQQYDYTRAYRGAYDHATGKLVAGERARPLQTLVWYPARAGGAPVTHGDYLRLGASEESFGRSEREIDAATALRVKNEFDDSGMDHARMEARLPQRAVLSAPALAGRYPVVIYAPSLSASAAENADLCEQLASHGYLVLASASLGPRSHNMPTDLDGIAAQAADIAFLIGYAHTLAQADTGKIAVAGYSWGGISNVFAAAADSRIKALVSLDGSVRYYPELMSASKQVSAARLAIPMLYLAARPRSLEDIAERGKPSTSFLNEMKYGDLIKVTLYPMEHFAFSSTYLRYASDQRYGEYSRAEANQAHKWAVTYVQRFLDAYLKDDAAARAFLANPPAKNGVPAHTLSVDTRRAIAAPATLEALAVELDKRGFKDAHAAYLALRKADAKFEPAEKAINNWGYDLMGQGETAKAIEVFKLGTVLFPNSGNCFESLAEGYEQGNDKAAAIRNYQHAVALDPADEWALSRLKELGHQAVH